jgi:thiopeptide-type bacteriocin biosynthesis protein
MTTHPSPSGAKWLSVHLQPAIDIDRFLVSYLTPFVESQRASQRLKRFFFIRYGDSQDLHIRLRLLPAPATSEHDHLEGLRTLMSMAARDQSSDAARSPLCVLPYDRTLHYFGESAGSVYSELLNEQTSHLALRILSKTLGNPSALVCLVGCMLLFLFCKTGAKSRDAAVGASVELAERILNRSASSPILNNTQSTTVLVSAMRNNWPTIESGIAADRNLRHILRLLLRASVTNPWVATHSLHLLCNKVGISPRHEHHLFCSLKILLAGESSL